MSPTNDQLINIWQTALDRAATDERERILTLINELVAHYERSSHPGLTRQSKAGVLHALRLLKRRIEG